MRSHGLRMLIGCLIPIALIFILPLFGVSDGIILFVFILFAAHMLLLGFRGSRHAPHTHHGPGGVA